MFGATPWLLSEKQRHSLHKTTAYLDGEKESGEHLSYNQQIGAFKRCNSLKSGMKIQLKSPVERDLNALKNTPKILTISVSWVVICQQALLIGF